jgi:hypothetical protein
MALMATTTPKGSKIAGIPFVILTGLITCNIKIRRKYEFASLENYINKFLGIKFHHVYLQVEIVLFLKRLSFLSGISFT